LLRLHVSQPYSRTASTVDVSNLIFKVLFRFDFQIWSILLHAKIVNSIARMNFSVIIILTVASIWNCQMWHILKNLQQKIKCVGCVSL